MEAELLIIADNDFEYGLKKGYYPKLKEALNNDKLEILSINEFKRRQIITKTVPLFNGQDCYLRNPYTGCYISVDDNDLPNVFVDSRTIAVKETLIRMGAKNISIYEETADKDTSQTTVNAEAGKGPIKGNVGVDYTNDISLNIKSKIEYHGPNNQPRKFERVKDFVISHGLGSDNNILPWLERFREDGKLSGTESIEVSFLSEIQNALRITASIDYKLFNAGIEFGHKHSHIHSITKKLSVDFG